MATFIGQEIEVRCGRAGRPKSFSWDGREHVIAAVEGMHRVIDHSRPWYRRKHRDNYVVRTEAGEAFRLYFHRGPGRKYWVLREKLED